MVEVGNPALSWVRAAEEYRMVEAEKEKVKQRTDERHTHTYVYIYTQYLYKICTRN